MIADFRTALQSQRTLLFDGGMGTQLAMQGVELGPHVNISAPEVVLEIQRAYRKAGADVLISNTFGANPLALSKSGEAVQLRTYAHHACQIAREALAGGGWLAGDIGPSGEYMEPYGSVTPEEMRKAFEDIASALAVEKVDVFVVETMTSAEELAVAITACRSVAPDLPIIASMSFDPVRDGFRTNAGVKVADATRTMEESGVDIIGTNCGSVSLKQMADIVRVMRQTTCLPILAQPNAGLPQLRDGKTHFDLDAKTFAQDSLEIWKAGARLLGGCCGTGPDHITALRHALDEAGV